jgi:hypothetical protein
MNSASDRRLGMAGLVLGALALFVSLGGDALAGRAFAALKNNSVTSKKVVNGSLKLADLKPAVRARIRAPGPQGPQGPPGPAGPAGGRANVPNGSITAAKLASNAVTSAKVAANAISQVKLADNAVGIAELANNAVGAAEVADNAIDTNEVADGALNAVDVGKAAGTVTLDVPPIAPGACDRVTFDAAVPTDGEAIVVTPRSAFPDDFSVTSAAGPGGQVIVTACNHSAADGDPNPVDFAYVIFDV